MTTDSSRNDIQASNPAADIEAAIDALANIPSGSMSREVLHSLGENVGFNKDDQMGEAYVVDEEDDVKVTVYNAYTGLPSVVMTTMLPSLFKKRFSKRHENIPESWYGKRVWSSTKPQVKEPPTYVCIFSEDAPERDLVVAAGLGHMLCHKSNLPSLEARNDHARHKHTSENKTWVAYQERSERAADRAATREMLAVIADLAKARSGEVATETPAKTKAS